MTYECSGCGYEFDGADGSDCPACKDAELERLRAENAKLRAVATAAADLVAKLPRCDQCGKPATRAHRRGEARFCDEHGPDVREYPRAAPLRATIAALEAWKEPTAQG